MSKRKCRSYGDNSENCFLTRDNDAGSQGCNGPLYSGIGDEMKLFGIASFVGKPVNGLGCVDGWTGWMRRNNFCRSFFLHLKFICEV